MRRSDEKLRFSEKERIKLLKDCIERVTNDENEWDHCMDGDPVDGQTNCACRDEAMQASNEKKTGKMHGLSGASF